MLTYLTLLISGREVLIDVEDAQILVDYSWHIAQHPNRDKCYVRGWSKERKKVLMHRAILKPLKAQTIDHINQNSLDNRRCNLRISTNSQNGYNRTKPKSNTSGFKGVSKSGKKWVANIGFAGTRIYLGTYDTRYQAAQAYNIAALKYHGEFANLNEL